MHYPSKVLEEAVEAIAALPGIGKKTALRLALHLIDDEYNKAERLAKSMEDLKSNIKHCKKCYMISDQEICEICRLEGRNKQTLCIVESIRDVMAIEDTGQYSGRYHILGGVISPIDGIGPEQLNIDSLIGRIAEEEIQEVIMAISPTIEGDTTIYYISKKIKHLDVQISTIARGVAFGGDLEYADEFTLGRSISGRIPYGG